jgi:hypothetical protein
MLQETDFTPEFRDSVSEIIEKPRLPNSVRSVANRFNNPWPYSARNLPQIGFNQCLYVVP